MNSRMRAALVRAGTATVLAVGLVAVAGPAYAADGPDLAVTPISLHIAKGVKQAKAKPLQVEIDNFGNADATGVTVRVDLTKLPEGVGWVRPDRNDPTGWVGPNGCKKAGPTAFTCTVDDIPAGQDLVIGIPLYSVGAKAGAEGSFRINAMVAGDTNPKNNRLPVDIKVGPRDYDVNVWAQDVYAGVVADGDEVGEETKTPVPAGGTAPLDAMIFNSGSRRVVGLAYALKLPEHASLASMPDDCVPDEEGVFAAICQNDEVVLKPGEVLRPPFTVKVADDAPVGVLVNGIFTAEAVATDSGNGEGAGDEARIASQAQRRQLGDADTADNQAEFDVFVGAAATQEPSPSPSESGNPDTPGGGEGGGAEGGGLPVTGPQTALIAGAGVAILAVGVLLLVGLRRRRTFSAE